MTKKDSRRMRAVIFDGSLRVDDDYPVPELKPGWARIKVSQSGICKTDMELMKGYMGFKGILGHEFVGVVEACERKEWLGKRVVGDINAACGDCEWCSQGLGRHCPNRTTLGIANHNGCMADYCVLPIRNLLKVPADMSDDRAVLIEPLAAACEIMEQLTIKGTERVVVLGDGRLGILCAWVLSTVVSDLIIVGHHAEKLKLAKWRQIQTTLDAAEVQPGADIIVEATGSGRGIIEAMRLCRPRGTIVLKSTVAGQVRINLSPIVINEVCLLGSRCGQFRDAMRMLQEYPDMAVEQLITNRYPLEEALPAFERAIRKDAMKVILEIN